MADTTGTDWQRKSFAKGGTPEAAPSQMNPKTWGGPAPKMNSKIAKPTHPCGGMVKGGYADGGMVRGYADGGEVEADLKSEGMKASADEKVGLFERIRMGNIDDPSSEAYSRFGAGRGQRERIAQAASDENAAVQAEEARIRAEKAKDDADFNAMDKEVDSGRSVSGTEKAKPVVASKPVAKPAAKVMDTGDETARLLARFPKPSTAARPVRPARIDTTNIDSKTLLPKR